jgi:tRNA pseudouridine32 synthase/23S rRNA pseudouridine746 synthase
VTQSTSTDTPKMPPFDLKRVHDTLRTHYWSFILRAAERVPPTLVELLRERLPHIDPSSWVERFEFGGIYINGVEALHDMPLPFPVKVEYYEPKFPLAEAHTQFSTFTRDYILFHDDAIAVVYKPPHLSSMPAKEQRHFSLKAALERELGRTIHMPSRLDVSAQGLVVVSTSPAAHAGLQRAFETRSVHKTYAFASHGRSAWDEKSVTFPIQVSPDHPVLRIATTGEGQKAHTLIRFSHETIIEGDSRFVYTAHPITGRTHQIRVHAAASELPIAGDNFYGGTPASYLHLVSRALALPHPLSGASLEFELPQRLAPEWTLNQ